MLRCVQLINGSADHIAAINIAAKADVNQPIVSGFEHLSTPQEQAPTLSGQSS